MDGWLVGLPVWILEWMGCDLVSDYGTDLTFLGYKSIVNNNDNINEIPFPAPCTCICSNLFTVYFSNIGLFVRTSVRPFVCVPQFMWNALSDAEVFSGRMTVDVNDFDCVVVELTWLL